MKVYEHIRNFQLKYYETDFKDEMKISTALAYMEEAACSSADELGFGYQFVKSRKQGFMITNTCCEFLQPIKVGEKLTVKTWPTPPSFVVFGREYSFLNGELQTLMNASSRWCLVDMQTGKLLQSKAIDNQDYSTYNTAKVLENVQWKIPVFKKDEGELKFTLTIANSEYDHNMHVNNTRYADYCMNVFSVAELADKSVKRFSISYIKQCKEGETLRFYRKKDADGTYIVQGMNEADCVVVSARITFIN